VTNVVGSPNVRSGVSDDIDGDLLHLGKSCRPTVEANAKKCCHLSSMSVNLGGIDVNKCCLFAVWFLLQGNTCFPCQRHEMQMPSLLCFYWLWRMQGADYLSPFKVFYSPTG
jgi:hypothetical protein